MKNHFFSHTQRNPACDQFFVEMPFGKGVYIYRIKTDKGEYYGKLVIQR